MLKSNQYVKNVHSYNKINGQAYVSYTFKNQMGAYSLNEKNGTLYKMNTDDSLTFGSLFDGIVLPEAYIYMPNSENHLYFYQRNI